MHETAELHYDFGLSNEHVRENPDGSLTVSGYASNYDEDRVGDVVTREALTKALQGYQRNPQLLFNHSYSLPAGRVTRARVDDQGLWIEANLPKPATSAPEMVRFYWDAVKNGTMRAFSIGGKFTRDAARRLIAIDLTEISVAAVGINAGTLMSSQVGKAFGDEPVDDLAVYTESAQLRAAATQVEHLKLKVARMQLDELARSIRA